MKVKLTKNVWADTTKLPDGLTLYTIYVVTEIFKSNPCDKYFRIIDDNGEEQSWNSECFDVVEQDIVYPAIYTHFKHEEEPSKYIYATMFISYPVDNLKNEEVKDNYIQARHTETENSIWLFGNKKEHIHSKIDCEDILVIYRPLYGANETYARPLHMFTGKVDNIKYPKVKQKFRFELVKYYSF